MTTHAEVKNTAKLQADVMDKRYNTIKTPDKIPLEIEEECHLKDRCSFNCDDGYCGLIQYRTKMEE